VQLTESEFKIVAASKQVKAGDITFKVKNDGKLAHDVAIAGTSERTKLIPPGGTAELKVTLKPGTYELYCTVPGHKAAGMDLKVTVSWLPLFPLGGVAERSNAAVSKTVSGSWVRRGFKSLPLRSPSFPS